MATTDPTVTVPAEAGEVPTSHPRAFYFFFWGEFAERCSYYGMRTILPLYLTAVLAYPDATATALYSYFKATAYFLPLLGGFLADRYFGKYWTIVGFSVPYVLGHFILGIEDRVALLFALALLAGGSGVIKPNISTLMGLTYDQQRPKQEALRSSAFLWFYFSINVGAFLSMLFLPEVREWLVGPTQHLEVAGGATAGAACLAQLPGGGLVGIGPLMGDLMAGQALANDLRASKLPFAYQVTFQVPAWLMVMALGVFAAGKRNYAQETVGPPPPLSPEAQGARLKALLNLFGIFGIIVFFWVAYEQNDNLWTFFARDHIDLTLNMGIWKHKFAPDGFQFINSLLILILVPLFGVLFPLIDPKARVFKATNKILMGFLWTALAAGVMALAAFEAERTGAKVSAWWIVTAYFVLTVGEILLYATGLELAYTAAPESMKGLVTAIYLLTNTAGNLINAQVSPLYNNPIRPSHFYSMTACLTLCAAVAFFFVGKRFDKAQGAESAPAA